VKQHVRIYLLGLVALFFISTTGVTVYKHYCSFGGEFYGLFMDVNHDCGPDTAEEVHACCSVKDVNYDIQIKEECCTSDVDVYQIDTDLIYQDEDVELVKTFVCSIPYAVKLPFPKVKELATSNKAPPALTLNRRLSLFQRYLL